MKKRTLVRVELLALAAVLLLLLYRVVSGPPSPEGFVVFDDLESSLKDSDLRHAAFALQGPARFVIEGVGSFEGGAEAEALAAYGWILRRDDRTVAWAMTPARASRTRGSLAVQQDTLMLGPGTYDVYFNGRGNQIRFGRPGFFDRMFDETHRWQQEARKWMLLINPLDAASAEQARLLYDEEDADLAPAGPGLLWTSAPQRGRKLEDHTFEVRGSARLRVYAVGEFSDTPDDYGWIEELTTGERVWVMKKEETQPAGGVPENRVFDGTVSLGQGIYRIAFETDPGHSPRNWYGNAPFDPAAWGLSLFAGEVGSEQAVVPFDPWVTRDPIASITRVGDDEVRTAQVQVNQPFRAILYAMGELSGSNNRFDYGWLQRNDSEEIVWEMSREASAPAGGDDNNRVEQAFVTLDPGMYTLYYQTDGSHSYGDWKNGEPEHPERWGVTLFPLNPALDSSAVTVVGEASPQPGVVVNAAPQPPVPPPPALGTGEVLLQHVALTNETRIKESFSLSERTRLHIYATGEISLSGRYDYGWIERESSGEIVWEMTWENTRPAGGEDRNRRFDGLVTLPAGTYVAHFRTDFSHAFGDFGDGGPADPKAWGLTIEKL